MLHTVHRSSNATEGRCQLPFPATSFIHGALRSPLLVCMIELLPWNMKDTHSNLKNKGKVEAFIGITSGIYMVKMPGVD